MSATIPISPPKLRTYILYTKYSVGKHSSERSLPSCQRFLTLRPLYSKSRFEEKGRECKKSDPPASRKPNNTLSPAICSQFFTKPIPIMQEPHSRVMTARWMRGPILRTMTVDGGWKTM